MGDIIIIVFILLYLLVFPFGILKIMDIDNPKSYWYVDDELYFLVLVLLCVLPIYNIVFFGLSIIFRLEEK